MPYRTSFPVVGYRRDIDGALQPVLVQDEPHTVISGYIRLRELPRVEGAVAIAGMTEVTSGVPGPGQYRVNYATGRVYFSIADENAQITATYYGVGTLVGEDEINWLWDQMRNWSNTGQLVQRVTGDVFYPDNVRVLLVTTVDMTAIVTIPDASECPGRIMTVKKVGGAYGVAVISHDFSLIDGQHNTSIFNTYEYVTIISDGVEYHIIAM